jgi:hypothetical protein
MGVYTTCVVAVFALLVVSVVKGLLFTPPAGATGTRDASIAECRSAIALQLRRLDARVAETLGASFAPDPADQARRSAVEQQDWDRLGAQRAKLRGRCLAAAGSRGEAARDLAEALDALGQVERGYRDLLERYHHGVAADRHRVRQSLAGLGRELPPAAGDPR